MFFQGDFIILDKYKLLETCYEPNNIWAASVNDKTSSCR
jgi:hypothetical protein